MNIVSDLTQRLFGILRKEPIKDTHELLDVCTGYAVTKLQRDTLEKQCEAEVLEVKDRYARKVLQLDTELKHHFKRIKTWAEKHRTETFGGKQTFLIGGHELEFRQSPGAVKTADELEEEDVVDRILSLPISVKELPNDIEITAEVREQLARNAELKEVALRVAAELEKKAILRIWRQSDAAGRANLEALGLVVKFEEKFNFTPALVDLPSNTASAKVNGKEAA